MPYEYFQNFSIKTKTLNWNPECNVKNKILFYFGKFEQFELYGYKRKRVWEWVRDG